MSTSSKHKEHTVSNNVNTQENNVIDHRSKKFADGFNNGGAAPAEAVSSSILKAHQVLLNTYAKGFEDYLGAFDQWAEFAIDIENQNGSSQIVRRLEYNLANKCQAAWIALYGNRTEEEVKQHAKTDVRTVRFCATENVNYWEARWFGNQNDANTTFINDDGEVIYTGDTGTVKAGLIDQQDGMYGPSFEKQNCMIRLEEARLNLAMCKAEYEMYAAMYETLIGTNYVFKPYEENRTPVVTQDKAVKMASKAAALAVKYGRNSPITIVKKAGTNAA